MTRESVVKSVEKQKKPAASDYTMQDVMGAWHNLENNTLRYSARLCEVLCAWLDGGAPDWNGKPLGDAWAPYLAAAFGVTRSRVYQLEQAGRTRKALSTFVGSKPLARLGEGHLRPFTGFAEDPKLLKAAWSETQKHSKSDAKHKGNVTIKHCKRGAESVAPAKLPPKPKQAGEKMSAIHRSLKLKLIDRQYGTLLTSLQQVGADKTVTDKLVAARAAWETWKKQQQ